MGMPNADRMEKAGMKAIEQRLKEVVGYDG